MLYDYECENCTHVMCDVYQSIKDEPLISCPSCGKDALRRVIYGGISSFVRNVNTVGQLADKNWNKLGSYKKSEILEKQQSTDPKSPLSQFGNATPKEINKMTQAQKHNYIITGEK